MCCEHCKYKQAVDWLDAQNWLRVEFSHGLVTITNGHTVERTCEGLLAVYDAVQEQLRFQKENPEILKSGEWCSK